MRAYTSLAGHILGSHSDINGYYELHQDYCQDDSVEIQIGRYLENDTLKPHSHFLFDKLLHNHYQLSEKLVRDNRNRILVSLRKPEPTIKSILRLFRNKPRDSSFQQEPRALNYYCDRLQQLSEFCKKYEGCYHYYDAEDWVQQPDTLLLNLQHWLNLDTPLSGCYQQFSQTGKARAGDSSAAIKSGEIKRETSDYSDIKLGSDSIEIGEQSYTQSRAILTQHSA